MRFISVEPGTRKLKVDCDSGSAWMGDDGGCLDGPQALNVPSRLQRRLQSYLMRVDGPTAGNHRCLWRRASSCVRQ